MRKSFVYLLLVILSFIFIDLCLFFEIFSLFILIALFKFTTISPHPMSIIQSINQLFRALFDTLSRGKKEIILDHFIYSIAAMMHGHRHDRRHLLFEFYTRCSNSYELGLLNRSSVEKILRVACGKVSDDMLVELDSLYTYAYEYEEEQADAINVSMNTDDGGQEVFSVGNRLRKTKQGSGGAG